MTPIEGLNDDFRDCLRALVAESAEFVVVGAYALAFHGTPRATGDIDILIRPDPRNASRVWKALARFGAPLQAMGLDESDFAAEGMVYQIGLPPRRIDILTRITGITFEEVWSSREEGDFETFTIAFIGREALIRNKLACGRAKDLADVERLDDTRG